MRLLCQDACLTTSGQPWLVQYEQPQNALHWLLVANNLRMDPLIARCEQLLSRHVIFLCNAKEAAQLPPSSLLRIMKVSCAWRLHLWTKGSSAT